MIDFKIFLVGVGGEKAFSRISRFSSPSRQRKRKQQQKKNERNSFSFCFFPLRMLSWFVIRLNIIIRYRNKKKNKKTKAKLGYLWSSLFSAYKFSGCCETALNFNSRNPSRWWMYLTGFYRKRCQEIFWFRQLFRRHLTPDLINKQTHTCIKAHDFYFQRSCRHFFFTFYFLSVHTEKRGNASPHGKVSKSTFASQTAKPKKGDESLWNEKLLGTCLLRENNFVTRATEEEKVFKKQLRRRKHERSERNRTEVSRAVLKRQASLFFLLGFAKHISWQQPIPKPEEGNLKELRKNIFY